MTQSIAFCILGPGVAGPSLIGSVKKLLDDVPGNEMELRVGLSIGGRELHELIGSFCPDGTVPDHQRLPNNVDRYRWITTNNVPIIAWTMPPKVQLKQVLHDVPLATEYTAIVTAQVHFQDGWWMRLHSLLDQGVDYIGEAAWADYKPEQMDVLQDFSWFMGVPLARREGRAGVSFMKPGLIVVKTDGIRQANFPDSCQWPRRTSSDGCDEYMLLGEIARQLGWTSKDYSPQKDFEPVETK